MVPVSLSTVPSLMINEPLPVLPDAERVGADFIMPPPDHLMLPLLTHVESLTLMLVESISGRGYRVPWPRGDIGHRITPPGGIDRPRYRSVGSQPALNDAATIQCSAVASRN